LVLIGSIDLPPLFENVILPSAVRGRIDIANPPLWLSIHETPAVNSTMALWKDSMKGKQPQSPWPLLLGADLLLMDDRKGVIVARAKDSV
jgi:hypothetical protein